MSVGIESDYPLFVPRSFVDLMEKGNPNDPLLLQILPRQEEQLEFAGFSRDPLGEFSEGVSNSVSNPILKKYAGRLLLLTSGCCGIHCRFCFRRFFPKSNNNNKFEKILEPIRNETTIEEIILSGGDPLMLDDAELERLFCQITEIAHIKRIRIHSRLPVVLPSRITPELIKIFSLSLPVYLVLHINHPNELSHDFLTRRKLLTTPVVMSQTVLLKGVNDNADVLTQLFGQLANHQILPYYLHQLDRIQGAAHFEVSPELGIKLMEQLRQNLPGYAVPKYVREIPGTEYKMSVGNNF
jgi:EF-P beta-lysylation protein EpmB